MGIAASAAILFALLRVPSLFEPYWYTDEAGYSVTARDVLQGARLYSEAWTNKPPLQIWTVAATQVLFGPTEWGLHLATLVFGLVAVAAVAVFAASNLTFVRALAASLGFAFVVGLPYFDAQLAVPESFLFALTAWGGVLVLWRALKGPQGRFWGLWWALLSGVLMGLALGYQQTVAVDEAVLVFVMLVLPGIRLKEALLQLGSAVAVALVWLLPVVAQSGFHEVWFSLAGFYVGYTQTSAPTDWAHRLLLLLTPALAVAGGWWLRRAQNPLWTAYLWAAGLLWVAALANRDYPHFWTPAVAPAFIAIASTPRLLRGWRLRFLPLAASCATLAVMAAYATPFDDVRVQAYFYFPGAAATGSLDSWKIDFNSTNAPADVAVSNYILAHYPRGVSAVLWSSSAWPYILADLPDRMPAPPIYNDVILLGSSSAAARYAANLHPRLIVTSEEGVSQYPDIEPYLKRDYRQVYAYGVDRLYERVAG